MRILVKNIKKLLHTYANDEAVLLKRGKDLDDIKSIQDAYLIIEDGYISDFGSKDLLNRELRFDKTIDAQEGLVMPAYIDSHTHLVHATTREDEFVQRIKGATYAEIAAKGGGILNSAQKLTQLSEEELFQQALQRLQSARELGTGAIEIKSGYGLTLVAELKMLRVIARLKEQNIMPIKATFLGAHAYPSEFKENHQGYIRLIIQEMLPAIAQEKLADYIDVFCEDGFFSVEETAQILEAGLRYDLKPKIHANQLNRSGGVQVGVRYNAISVDHLESIGTEEIECLANSNTLPVLLPGAAFFLGMHYQPARMLVDAGLPLVLASDYNPGSCPSFNMNLIQSLACTQMKLTPQEALNASTINAAFALELENSVGVVKIGHKAMLNYLPGYASESLIPYWFGENKLKPIPTS